MAGQHSARVTSWVSVALIVIASVLLGFALPMQSLALGIVGGVVLLAGVVVGLAFGLLDDAY